MDSGFESDTAFRQAFIKRFELYPSVGDKDVLLSLDWLASPQGTPIVTAYDAKLPAENSRPHCITVRSQTPPMETTFTSSSI